MSIRQRIRAESEAEDEGKQGAGGSGFHGVLHNVLIPLPEKIPHRQSDGGGGKISKGLREEGESMAVL
ncbi:hypothetical protein AGMMS49545_17770 [Betaproteobacteria bacterium]|nr:hypothetical protein AGMMS49545_17770 [Betaproteobacteria bacterium]GHU44829.1 hypothetical protein AGMMS50289_14130 [Betaproteobacteria bacterium]